MKTLLPTAILLLTTVLLHAETTPLPAFDIQPGDIMVASVTLESADHANLVLTLTPEKHAKFTQFTTDNHTKKVSIVVNGAVVAEPVINEIIRGGTITFAAQSPEEALQQAKTLLGSKP